MDKAVWLSFDFGVRGDYEGMYAWLDAHDAKECGDNLAFLNYTFEGDLVASLTEDIKSAVEIDKKSRIYVIWLDKERTKMRGQFIVGGRKAPPWAGHAPNGELSETDEG